MKRRVIGAVLMIAVGAGAAGFAVFGPGAIGARGRHVMLQFLIEALALSLAGGLIGIVIGVAVSIVIALLAGWAIAFNPLTIAVPVVFSLIVGIVFGVWPARQAARLDPVVALRYE